MTKEQNTIIMNHSRSHARVLQDVYTSWSWKKQSAYDYCRDCMTEKEGYDFKIISSNSFQFTCGFYFYEGDKEMFKYFTASRELEFEVN